MNTAIKKLFQRPLGGVVSLNDVFPQHVDANENFWERNDPDAELTEWFCNRPFSLMNMQIFVNERMGQAGYLSVLVDNLIKEQRDQVAKYTKGSSQHQHPDTQQEVTTMKKAQAVVINCAPRSKHTTQNGQDNGRSFYCAVTASGVEVYATPLDHLAALNAFHRIIALYRITNHDNPEYSNTEQFRSRLITKLRRWPETFETIFEHPNQAALIDAKRKNKYHTSSIPHLYTDTIDYVDRFGNVRLLFRDRAKMLETFERAGVGNKVRLRVGEGKDHVWLEPFVTSSMREAPYHQLALYINDADPSDDVRADLKTPVYAELIIQEDVSTLDHISAAKELYAKYPDFLQAPIALEN